MELIETEGLEAVTIAALARRIDASVGGMYRYYPSKEAIFVALQHRAIAGFGDYLEGVLQEAGADPLERIRVAFGAWHRHAERAPSTHRLLDSFMSAPGPYLSEEDAKAVNASLAPVLERLAELFAEAVEAGALRPGDAQQRTHVVWAAMHGLDHFRKRDRLSPEALQVPALRDALFEATLAGWA